MIKFTPKEIQILKEALKYSIYNVENSKNYTHETYDLKRAKIQELEDLKVKIQCMAG